MNPMETHIYYSIGKSIVDRQAEDCTAAADDRWPVDDQPWPLPSDVQPVRGGSQGHRWPRMFALLLRLRPAR